MSKPMKDPLKLTKEALEHATASLDEGLIPPGRALTARERARWDNARSAGTASIHIGPGRPKVGEGAVAVPVSVEAGLLRRAIAKAESLRMKRSEYFAKALQLLTDGQVEVGGASLTVEGAKTSAGPKLGTSNRQSAAPRRAAG